MWIALSKPPKHTTMAPSIRRVASRTGTVLARHKAQIVSHPQAQALRSQNARSGQRRS